MILIKFDKYFFIGLNILLDQMVMSLFRVLHGDWNEFTKFIKQNTQLFDCQRRLKLAYSTALKYESKSSNTLQLFYNITGKYYVTIAELKLLIDTIATLQALLSLDSFNDNEIVKIRLDICDFYMITLQRVDFFSKRKKKSPFHFNQNICLELFTIDEIVGCDWIQRSEYIKIYSKVHS